MTDQPALQAPAGSIFQLFCTTAPFLVVFTYFLYLAAVRPNLVVYSVADGIDDDVYLQQLYEEAGSVIALMDMLHIFLTVLTVWSALAIYLKMFVPRRRALVKDFMERGTSVVGDVMYDNRNIRCRFSKYAFVVYPHPNQDEVRQTLQKSNHMTTPMSDEQNPSTSELPPSQWMVRKRVRTYQPYTREIVSILILPDRPFSGQAKGDLEIDYATFTDTSRDRIQSIMKVVWGWIAFSFLSAIYIAVQIHRVPNEMEGNPLWAWFFVVFYLIIVIPVLALGGNALRWAIYKHWVLNKGVVFEKHVVDRHGATTGQNDTSILDGICMSNVCGPSNPTLDTNEPSTNYREMA
jgi:hypothetical protein